MSEKKEKIIFWMIGVGCGIGISGIVGTGISLTMQSNQVVNIQSEKELSSQETEQIIYEVPLIGHIENDKVLELMEKEEVSSDVNEIVEESKEQVNVFIPAGLGAGEISEILEENKVIEDANLFVTYIANQNMSKSLRQGNFIFPVNISNEEALEILLRKK